MTRLHVQLVYPFWLTSVPYNQSWAPFHFDVFHRDGSVSRQSIFILKHLRIHKQKRIHRQLKTILSTYDDRTVWSNHLLLHLFCVRTSLKDDRPRRQNRADSLWVGATSSRWIPVPPSSPSLPEQLIALHDVSYRFPCSAPYCTRHSINTSRVLEPTFN